MKITNLYPFYRFFVLLCLLLIVFNANAGAPLWAFEPRTSATAEVLTNGTATIDYLVTNQSSKTHILTTQSVPGITQITNPGKCENNFMLRGHESCILSLLIAGNVAPNSIGFGPIVCQQGSTNQCYRPNINNILRVNPKLFISAAGSYSASVFLQSYPMLVMSSDGEDWQYKIQKDLNFPEEYSIGTFGSSYCTNNICIATGFLYKGIPFVTPRYPSLAQSTDGGATWEYVINSGDSLQDYNNFGIFSKSSCAANNCIVSGQYVDTSNVAYPILAQTQNNGGGWSYKIQKGTNLPEDYQNNGVFYSLECSGNICVAAGKYNSSVKQYLMLAQSNDGGNNWTYKIEKGLNLPTDEANFISGDFSSVSCFENNCLAVGRYFDASNVSYPLLAQSNDNGETWTYKIKQATNLPDDFFNDGSLQTVNCYGKNCVAGGSYSNNSSSIYPMVVQSNDAGNSWTYKVKSGLNLPIGYSNSGIFSDVNCSGAVCIAAGRYEDISNKFYLMLAQSKDNGINWSYKIQAGLNLPTDYNSNAVVNGANCTGNVCTIVGQYWLDDSITIFAPFLASSKDGGDTWSYKIENGLNLPEDYSNNGSLY